MVILHTFSQEGEEEDMLPTTRLGKHSRRKISFYRLCYLNSVGIRFSSDVWKDAQMLAGKESKGKLKNICSE
jgi:hypothetical protein